MPESEPEPLTARAGQAAKTSHFVCPVGNAFSWRIETNRIDRIKRAKKKTMEVSSALSQLLLGLANAPAPAPLFWPKPPRQS